MCDGRGSVVGNNVPARLVAIGALLVFHDDG